MRADSHARRSVTMAAVSALLVAALVAVPGAARATPAELFFSEYIEGTSNNKALEIFNGTGAAVNLSTAPYNVQMFFNGSLSAGLTINLTGTVASGDVYVLAQSSASAPILAQADQTNGAGWFNGDDAVALRRGTTVLDVIAQIGFDPGTEWGTGLTSTADNTLRRKPTIEAGDTNGADAFDPAAEWDGFATDTFGGLGAHSLTVDPVTANCDGPITTDQGTAAPGTVSASDRDGVVVGISITSVTPSPFPGTVTAGNLVPALATGGTATVQVTVDANTPAGTYSVLMTATNNDSTPQTGTCTLTVQVRPPVTPIYAIQGDGRTSPFAGALKRTTGVVTVILGSGFFMQDITGDGDADTSDGIFVFTGNAVARTLDPGDQVDVTGTVTEFRPTSRPRDLTLTEFSGATVTKIATGVPLPALVSITDRPDEVIDPNGIDTFETLEGMLVSIQGPRVSGPTNDFGELVVAASGDHANMTAGGSFLVEPLAGGAVDYNPERIMVDDEARVPGGTGAGTRINNPMVPVVVGNTATGPIVGALDYQFSNYRVQANHLVSSVLTGSAPTSPIAGLRSPQPYEGRIATFNVENLFDCVNDPAKDDDHPTCSAAAQAALETQLSKLAMAFEQELGSPQVVIIEETENTAVLTGDASGNIPGTGVLGIPPIEALLPRIDGHWDAVSFDASDERGIEVAFVFDTDRVTLHDAFLATDVLPDGGLFSGSATIRPGREPLVGHFTLDDVDLILVGNHLKSKGGPQFGVDTLEAGDDPLYGAFQPPVRWTETQLRHAQADYVRDLVDHLLAHHPGANIVVGGDLNDFAFPEPGEGMDTVARITTSPTDPLTNVIELVPAERRYTFLFEGNSQVLDHMLLNEEMAALLRDQDIAHFNAGFPSAFGGDPTVTFRASDHDPLVVYFCTDLTAPTLSASATPHRLWPPNHKYVTVQATFAVADDRDPSPSVELVSVTSNEPDDGVDDGNTRDDIVIDDDTFRLRAERSGSGTGRIYTITYRATDACGNESVATATVTVPLEQ